MAKRGPVWTQGGDSFTRVTSADEVNGAVSDQATIWRWRAAFQHDFAARMDWTIKPYKAANHPPIVKVSQTVRIDENNIATLSLDARATKDPDGDRLQYQWFHYPEAGAGPAVNLAEVVVKSKGPIATVTSVAPCRKAWIEGLLPCKGDGHAHIILAVTDDGKPALTRYWRVNMQVPNPKSPSDPNPVVF